MKLEKSLPRIQLFNSKNIDELASDKGLGLEEYLLRNPLQSVLPLTSDGKFCFHWGDWKESTIFQQNLLSNGELQTKRLQELQEALNELKKQPVWANNKVKTVEINLYDLYKSYLNPSIRKVWFNDKENVFQVSLSSEIGPYVPLSSMRWFNKNIYSCFVFKNILVKKILNRNFRLGIDIPIFCQLDEDVIDDKNISLHQLTRNGVLLKIQGAHNFNRFLVSENTILEFGTKIFKKLSIAKSGVDFKNILNNEDRALAKSRKRDRYIMNVKDVMMKYQNLQNYKSSTSTEFFIFVGWDDFIPEGKSTEIGELMSYFMGCAELLFSQELGTIV